MTTLVKYSWHGHNVDLIPRPAVSLLHWTTVIDYQLQHLSIHLHISGLVYAFLCGLHHWYSLIPRCLWLWSGELSLGVEIQDVIQLVTRRTLTTYHIWENCKHCWQAMLITLVELEWLYSHCKLSDFKFRATKPSLARFVWIKQHFLGVGEKVDFCGTSTCDLQTNRARLGLVALDLNNHYVWEFAVTV